MIHMSPDASDADPGYDTVEIITRALTEKFGIKAIGVTERQWVTACPGSRDTWRGIVGRLGNKASILESR